MSRWLRWRVLADRLAAGVLLVPLAPVIMALAVAIRRGSRGPGLIRVPRVGRGGVPFGMLKLRTMRATSDGGLAQGAAITAGDDDRITDLGRRLRRWRLDELPQLVNVVRGQMALIGPRPEAPDYVDPEDDRWRDVLQTPPGIAGATQVLVSHWEATALEAATSDAVYRTEILPVKLALDRWYVRGASPALDLLVLRSLLGSLTGRGAPTLRAKAERAVPELAGAPHG